MLNPVATEALYSATFVENYLDCLENLPEDLQRQLTRMRELDVTYRACLRDVQNNIHNSMLSKDESNTTLINKRNRAISRIEQKLIIAQELGDEKLQIVQRMQDLIDHRSRQLDLDYRNLVSSLDYGNGNSVKEEHMVVDPPANVKDNGGDGTSQQQAGAGTSNGTGGRGGGQGNGSPTQNHDRDRDKDRTVERASKRARRARNENASSGENNERGGGNGREDVREGRGDRERGQNNRDKDRDRGDTHNQSAPAPQQADPPQKGGNTGSGKKNAAGKMGTGKKKKRKSRQTQSNQRDETPPPEDPDPIDPDEPTYCLCDQISFGEMILCDNDLCPIEWFHFSCVSLNTKPKGKWFCPKCRGDRPNIMKPKSQFFKELERYNKEKEEKA